MCEYLGAHTHQRSEFEFGRPDHETHTQNSGTTQDGFEEESSDNPQVSCQELQAVAQEMN